MSKGGRQKGTLLDLNYMLEFVAQKYADLLIGLLIMEGNNCCSKLD